MVTISWTQPNPTYPNWQLDVPDLSRQNVHVVLSNHARILTPHDTCDSCCVATRFPAGLAVIEEPPGGARQDCRSKIDTVRHGTLLRLADEPMVSIESI
jgi:hypothetical protein